MPRYAIVIEKRDGSNYSAFVPDLPGCIVTGDSVEEVKRLMEAAVAFHIEGMREDGLEIPELTTDVTYCEVVGSQGDV